MSVCYFTGNVLISGIINIECLLPSCQPNVTVTSCFVYTVIRDLEPIDHLCINPILDRIDTQVNYRFALAKVECTS